MTPTITSLLDPDPYKFTMWQATLHRHPQNEGKYTSACRNRTVYPGRPQCTKLSQTQRGVPSTARKD